MNVIPGPPYPGLYQHFRGDIYIVHKVITDETNENQGRIMVLYEKLETKQTFVRSIREFSELVHMPDGIPAVMYHLAQFDTNCDLCVPRFYQMTPSDILNYNRPKVI